MQDKYKQMQDRVFSLDEFNQFEQLNHNTNSRIPVFFCIDVSGSMGSKVGFLETRISLLSKVMKKLLKNMKAHPILSERAVVSVVTYNNKAILHLPAMDLCILDIDRVINFRTENQTIFSLGLNRTLQAIDQYRDSMRQSDVETFIPMLVFMTDGEPVGDDNREIEKVYNEIWRRVQNNDLYVFPIGISGDANMSYVYNLDPDHHAYQMINENDFEKIFKEIEKIFEKKDSHPVEEGMKKTNKSSIEEETKDTGTGMSFVLSDLERMIDNHNM